MVSQPFPFLGNNSAYYEMADYDFDNMTISEFCAITDFFPNRDEWLWELERIQVTNGVKQLDRNRWVYASDLKRIIDNYNEDYKTFEATFHNINQSLIAAFAALKARILDSSNLPQFLELITFQRNGDVSTLSSPYGTVSMARIRRR